MVVLSDPTDTLAYHQSRVFTTQRDMRETPAGDVAKAIKKYMASVNDKAVKPESEALWFYGMNHAVALIATRRAPLEPMTEQERQIVEVYHKQCAKSAVRAFYYLVLICTREARHSHSKKDDASKLKEMFGKEIADFFCTGNGSEGDIHQKFLKNTPKASIGAYVEALRWQFYHSKFSGGYGGKAWGAVTDCLVRFVTGEYSAEMMMDTVWTLCHNNGPIFNKGHLYAMYTGNLVRILDIQRSGQVPQAILHDQKVSPFVDISLRTTMLLAQKMFPDDIGDFVDWYVVEALGSVHKYDAEKKEQKAKHGLSPAATKAQKEADLKALAAAKAAAEAHEKEMKEYFYVTPQLKVKKIERAA